MFILSKAESYQYPTQSLKQSIKVQSEIQFNENQHACIQRLSPVTYQVFPFLLPWLIAE